MELNHSQKKLLLELIKDQENSPTLFKPGPYWSYKCKKAANWILNYGFDNFRGLNSPVGTSYADNFILDKRNEYGIGIKSKIANKISRFPLIKNILDAQIKLTKEHIKAIIDNKSHIYRKNEKVNQLLKNYVVKDTVNYGSVGNFEINNKKHAFQYLDDLHLIDLINNKINLNKIDSFFEIGGGFGANIHLLLNNFKNIRKVLYLDVAPNLFIATEYLRNYFGDSVKDYLELKNKKIIFSNNENLEIYCISPWQLPNVNSQIDHFHNSCSFAEMTFEIVENYSKYIKKIIKKNGSLSLMFDKLDTSRYVSNEDILNMFNLPFEHEEYKDLYLEKLHDLYCLKN